MNLPKALSVMERVDDLKVGNTEPEQIRRNREQEDQFQKLLELQIS